MSQVSLVSQVSWLHPSMAAALGKAGHHGRARPSGMCAGELRIVHPWLGWDGRASPTPATAALRRMVELALVAPAQAEQLSYHRGPDPGL